MLLPLLQVITYPLKLWKTLGAKKT